MHQLRDALLSPTPRGVPALSAAQSLSQDKQDVRECVARGELGELRGAWQNRTWIVTERYCNSSDGVDCLEEYVHSLWHIYYQLARHTSHEKPEHDSLVFDILRVQGLGPLTRPVSGLNGVEIARTVEGTLWNDLPFLVTDMTEFWIHEFSTMPGAQRLNFASFLAKLAATRVSKDRMCQIALLLFRAAFEDTERELTTGDPDEQDAKRTTRDLMYDQLLPSACAWIKEAGPHLVLLSSLWWNDCPSTIGEGGPLYVESDLGRRSSPAGFSPWRYMYWMKRLYEIWEEAKEAQDARLEEYAQEAYDSMASLVKDRNSDILRTYRNGGEAVLNDKHLKGLRDDYEGAVTFIEEDGTEVETRIEGENVYES